MSTENRDRVRRALREFRKYEGDGQGGTGALPIGDPASGAHNPPKSLLREALEPVALGLDTVNTSVAAAAASETAAASSASAAASSASDAQTAKTQADLAAISAGAPLFASTAAGLAGTVNGDIFLVSTAAGMRVYQNTAGTATFLGWLGEVLLDDVAALLASALTGFVAGDIIRTRTEGFSYKVAASAATDQHVTTAGGVKLYVLPTDRGEVHLEQFGAVGSGANDNALLTAAISVGVPVSLRGTEYKFNEFLFTTAAKLDIGRKTIIRNVQASGAKHPAIRFNGGGLTGSAIAVTHIGGAAGAFDHKNSLVDTITVADASSFAAGDTVRLSENAAAATETNVSAPSSQDYNHWDFRTIAGISGNDITFEEFIRLPFDTTRTLQLQKVSFLQGVHVSGGVHIGGTPSGGGVGLDHCRRSSVNNIRLKGNSEADPSGGEAALITNCWECSGENLGGWRGAFGVRFRFNQSCNFRGLYAKRTTNGGVMLVSNIFSRFGDIVLDSAGDDNGDGLGLHSANKFNTIGPVTVSGDRCYGAWIKQPSTDNTFLPFISSSGVTACILCMGARNTFQSVTVKGNNGPGVLAEADDVSVIWLDYQSPGTGFRLRSGYRGAYVRGRSISTGSDSVFSWDIGVGNCTSCDIDIEGGTRGLQYNSADRNETNKIIVRGPNPVYHGRVFRGRGWSWGAEVLGVTSTAKLLSVPGQPGDTGGLTPLVPPAGEAGAAYLITLSTRINIATANSQYQLLGYLGGWTLTEVRKGASSFAPALQVNGSNQIEILTASTSPQAVYALIERF